MAFFATVLGILISAFGYSTQLFYVRLTYLVTVMQNRGGKWTALLDSMVG